jgi:hypothetical protein
MLQPIWLSQKSLPCDYGSGFMSLQPNVVRKDNGAAQVRQNPIPIESLEDYHAKPGGRGQASAAGMSMDCWHEIGRHAKMCVSIETGGALLPDSWIVLR